MKKTYLAPTVETYKIQTHGMLAMSVAVTNDEFSGDANDVLGREGDFWEDEEY